jgi:L-ribulose-5-phosphate 3-epimerase
MGLTKQIGIMQGRLTPRIDGKIQAYPAKTWQKEFEIAKEIGYSAIEWIVEKPLEINALMSKSGMKEIKEIILKTGVKVDYVCADIFMQQPLVRMSEKIKEENKKILEQILINSKEIGAIGVEIPFVDASSIKTASEIDELISVTEDAFKLAGEIGINVSLETDLNAKEFKKLLEKVNLDHVKANYDIGNSASLGYEPLEELENYGQRILNVHVKDRKLGSTTVPLGTGNADIRCVFEKLDEIGYTGGITMQAARGEDDVATAREQLMYTLEMMKKI